MQEAKFGKIEGRQIKCPAMAITPLSQHLIELDQKKIKDHLITTSTYLVVLTVQLPLPRNCPKNITAVYFPHSEQQLPQE